MLGFGIVPFKVVNSRPAVMSAWSNFFELQDGNLLSNVKKPAQDNTDKNIIFTSALGDLLCINLERETSRLWK